MTISKIKDVASVNSATKHTNKINLPSRIDGAYAVSVENVINKWTFHRVIIKAKENHTINYAKMEEARTFKQAWTIGGMFDMRHPTRRKWRSTDNRNPNPSNINSSWRTMEQPPYMRGIDFTHPELW